MLHSGANRAVGARFCLQTLLHYGIVPCQLHDSRRRGHFPMANSFAQSRSAQRDALRLGLLSCLSLGLLLI